MKKLIIFVFSVVASISFTTSAVADNSLYKVQVGPLFAEYFAGQTLYAVQSCDQGSQTTTHNETNKVVLGANPQFYELITSECRKKDPFPRRNVVKVTFYYGGYKCEISINNGGHSVSESYYLDKVCGNAQSFYEVTLSPEILNAYKAQLLWVLQGCDKRGIKTSTGHNPSQKVEISVEQSTYRFTTDKCERVAGSPSRKHVIYYETHYGGTACRINSYTKGFATRRSISLPFDECD